MVVGNGGEIQDPALTPGGSREGQVGHDVGYRGPALAPRLIDPLDLDREQMCSHRPLGNLRPPMRTLMACALSPVRFFAPPWTVGRQTPLSMGFPRQEDWSGLPFLLQGIFPTQ